MEWKGPLGGRRRFGIRRAADQFAISFDRGTLALEAISLAKYLVFSETSRARSDFFTFSSFPRQRMRRPFLEDRPAPPRSAAHEDNLPGQALSASPECQRRRSLFHYPGPRRRSGIRGAERRYSRTNAPRKAGPEPHPPGEWRRSPAAGGQSLPWLCRLHL